MIMSGAIGAGVATSAFAHACCPLLSAAQDDGGGLLALFLRA